MANSGNVYLMYHELELSGRPLCQSEPGYVRYILPEKDFAEQMQFIAQSGRRGICVSAVLENPTEDAVVITFDDGCETDLLAAAPILKRLNFGATFYLTSGFVARQGYMSPAQVRELSGLGFEIGCHSMTHPYLPDLSDTDLRREVIDAKVALEQIVGRRVDHFSCPGGQFDRRVLQLAQEAGYKSVANSHIRKNDSHTDKFSLGRVSVMRGMPLKTFEGICDGSLLWRLRLRDNTNRAAKRILGNTMYDRLRATILGRGNE